jgi:hypothetical protein
VLAQRGNAFQLVETIKDQLLFLPKSAGMLDVIPSRLETMSLSANLTLEGEIVLTRLGGWLG